MAAAVRTEPTKAQQEAARVEDNRRVAFITRVRTLVGPIVARRLEVGRILEQRAAGATADAAAAAFALMEPVGAAVHPIKAQTVAHAREKALAYQAKTREWLESLGWDGAKAPYASYRLPKHEREQMDAVYRRFHMFTRVADGQHSRSMGDTSPHIHEWCERSAERHLENAERDAALQFDAFVCKLVAKVGDVTAAELRTPYGSVWGWSDLHVVLPDGARQVWHTKQIVNYSVLGNAYYQWPTRLLKGA